MAFQTTGKIVEIFNTEQKTETFKVREFVIEVPDGNYPQMVKFQAVQERCDALDALYIGQIVDVDFDLRGREWQGKYFTSLNAWRVRPAGADQHTPPPPPPVQDAPDFPDFNPDEKPTDDLPF